MSLLNVESYVFINVFYLVLFCIHVCVDDVIKKNMHQNVNKPKSRTARTVYGPIFLTWLFLCDYCQLFNFFCQDANKTGSNWAMWHQERLHDIKKVWSPFNTYNIKIHLADIFYLYDESPPSIFPLQCRYIYFLLYILLSQNPSLRYISVVIPYLLWTL